MHEFRFAPGQGHGRNRLIKSTSLPIFSHILGSFTITDDIKDPFRVRDVFRIRYYRNNSQPVLYLVIFNEEHRIVDESDWFDFMSTGYKESREPVSTILVQTYSIIDNGPNSRDVFEFDFLPDDGNPALLRLVISNDERHHWLVGSSLWDSMTRSQGFLPIPEDQQSR